MKRASSLKKSIYPEWEVLGIHDHHKIKEEAI